MPPWVIDATLGVLVLGITYAVYSERLWGAALIFVNVMFSGLIAFSFYEPVAELVGSNLGIQFVESVADFLSLIVLFSVVFTVFRLATDFLGATAVKFAGWFDQVGALFFGFLTAWYVVGMLLCMAETAPIHKQVLGYQWENHSLFGVDRFWLGHVHDATATGFDHNPPRPFDKDADFIKRYHNHRGFGAPDPSMPTS